MHRLKILLLNIGHAFHEACVCLLLGLRSSLRVGILLRSSLLCLLMFLFSTWLFYAYFQEIGLISAGIAFFAAAGGVLFGLLILVIACIPRLSLLTPALLGAGPCHLGYRGLVQVRHNAGALPPAPVSLPPPVPTVS